MAGNENENGMGLLQPAEPPPLCVRFCPSERELIELFLQPKAADFNFAHPQWIVQTMPNILQMHPDTINHNTQVYYHPVHNYYFSTRELLARNRPNRIIANTTDRWKCVSSKRIISGLNVIGHVETIELRTIEGLRTGWSVKEYRLADANNVFQTQVLVHMERDETKDQRLNFNLDDLEELQDGNMF